MKAKLVDGDQLQAELTRHIKEEMDNANVWQQKQTREGEKKPIARPVRRSDVANVKNALDSMVPRLSEMPAWIGEAKFPLNEAVICQNCAVHVPSGRIAHTSEFLAINLADFDYDPLAKPPEQWLHFLEQIWPNDQESIDALQEWIGYLMTADTRFQKILMMVGPPRSGKGTIGRVAKAVIGPANVAGPTLSSLSQNFGLWPLLDKTVAIVSDARLQGNARASEVMERLLSISGEDTITIDRKQLVPVTTKLNARFVILTNELLRMPDASGALASRFVILRLTKSFYGREDTTLCNRLLEERPAILLWAMEGYKRLHARGRFLQPSSGAELVAELQELHSPISAFINDRCILDGSRSVSVQDLYQGWCKWCGERGRYSGPENLFGRDLRAAAPLIGLARPRHDGERSRVYIGIGLK